MSAKSGPIAWSAYAVIRALFAVMQVFPIDWNLRSARCCARLWPMLMPRHRDRAVAHLARAFGDQFTSEELQQLADRCLASVAMFAVEAVCLPRLISVSTWSRHVSLVGFDDALRVLLSGKGAILVTGHYGAFELMGHVLAALGFDIVAVMRPLDNVYLNRYVSSARRTRGLTLLDKKGATSDAERLLRDGYSVAFVGDQDAGRKGLFVDFFGHPASTYKSIGLLAMATQCPIVVGYARRIGDVARYEIGVRRVLHPHEWETASDPLRWITQTYTTAIEEIVREAPEQYLWIHRRWKSEPRSKATSSCTP